MTTSLVLKPNHTNRIIEKNVDSNLDKIWHLAEKFNTGKFFEVTVMKERGRITR